jgi:superfamily II DNA or RNA helicase
VRTFSHSYLNPCRCFSRENVLTLSPNSLQVLFTQFVGRAVRKIDGEPDTVIATVVSHIRFNQRENYDNMDTINDVFPEEDAEATADAFAADAADMEIEDNGAERVA